MNIEGCIPFRFYRNNEVEENVAAQGNINYEALQNLSVNGALAFFSS